MTDSIAIIKSHVEVNRELFPTWREGQLVFNVACDLFTHKVNMLRGSTCDPFHNNEKIDDFYEALNSMFKNEYTQGGKQVIDVEKELFKSANKYMKASMDFKALQNIMRIERGVDPYEEKPNKPFYRLGEGMTNRKRRKLK